MNRGYEYYAYSPIHLVLSRRIYNLIENSIVNDHSNLMSLKEVFHV